MKLQVILIYLVLSLFNVTLANCIENPFAETKLPKEMPENTRFRYSENGGMAPSWYRIEVKGNVLSVEDKDMQEEKAAMWYAEISKTDKEAVYKIFVEGKFDLIKNEKPEGTVYDAGSQSVYIRAGKVSKNLSYGPNSPLSKKNASKWRAAATAIKTLANKYKPQAKPIADNYTVISYSKRKHSHIFKDVGYRKLDFPEIDSVKEIVERAVKEYNEKVTTDQRIENLEKYKFQLMSAANAEKETIVWVNAFCGTKESWRRQLVTVDDGGNCYFNFYVNLTKKTYDRFSVNGQG